MNQATNEDAVQYRVEQSDDAIIQRALTILQNRLASGPCFTGPAMVREYLILQAAKHRRQEVFSVLFLNSQNCVLEYREMAHGTANECRVYPREIARAALELGAVSVILTHNHPSGSLHPSQADQVLTKAIKDALGLIDVNVLDHIITGGGSALSMAEQGAM